MNVRGYYRIPNGDVVHLVIDDTLTLRASKKAPGSQFHHRHGNKPNLASFVRGQCWVSLAMIARRHDKAPAALPILSRLIPGAVNTVKLIAANTLIRSVYRLFEGVKVRVLVDSWYMRRRFIASMQGRDFDVIGQVRIDTRLYDEPEPRCIPSKNKTCCSKRSNVYKKVGHNVSITHPRELALATS